MKLAALKHPARNAAALVLVAICGSAQAADAGGSETLTTCAVPGT